MRLLLAEDEPELSRALVTILQHSNYIVDAVDNGQDALVCLDSGIYDGAVLDIMMPRMDGLTVLKTIRSHGNQIPVLMLTAKSEIDDRVNGLDSGADDYLTKPFAMKELLARIRAMTRRKQEKLDDTLTFCNLSLNRGSFELCTETGTVRLAKKEFQMMEMLMSNPDRVISADQFLNKIWGWDSEAEANIVWVNLSNLRKKLTSINAHVQIRAIRNLGYSLEAADD